MRDQENVVILKKYMQCSDIRLITISNSLFITCFKTINFKSKCQLNFSVWKQNYEIQYLVTISNCVGSWERGRYPTSAHGKLLLHIFVLILNVSVWGHDERGRYPTSAHGKLLLHIFVLILNVSVWGHDERGRYPTSAHGKLLTLSWKPTHFLLVYLF